MLLESPNLRADSVLDSLGPCIMGQRGGYENRSQRAWDCPPPPSSVCTSLRVVARKRTLLHLLQAWALLSLVLGIRWLT